MTAHYGSLEYGSVECDGVAYKLLTPPLADSYCVVKRGTVYRAYALSPDGDEVEVLWKPTKEWLASEAVAECGRRGIQPDMQEIADQFGVPVDFVICDLCDESCACDWDYPAAVWPSH